MATLEIWSNFSKRKNSTKRPSGGNVIDVKLKENTSLESPTFIITGHSDTVYCKFQNNYYYVEDVVFVTNDIIELKCSMDALATNKDAIIGSSQFVKYYTHNNVDICDSRLSTKTEPKIATSTGSFAVIGQATGSTNAVIVNVNGQTTTSSYVMSRYDASRLLEKYDEWFDDPNNNVQPPDPSGSSSWVKIGEIENCLSYMAQEIKYAVRQFLNMGNCKDCIRSAHTLPVTIGNISGTSENIFLGRFDTQKSHKRVTDQLINDSVALSIPWQATDWRRNSPYTEIYVYIPYIGVISIPVSSVIGQTGLSIMAQLDVTSGDTIFRVSCGGHVIGQYSTNLASGFAIGGSNISPTSVGNAMLGAVGSISGGAVGIGVGAIGLANALTPTPTCIGSNSGGAILNLGDQCKCIVVYHDTAVEPNSISAIKGTPYNGVMSIPTSGYVECMNASVPSTAYGVEKDTINSYLNNGIYIE